MALFNRERTGKGMAFEVSLFDSMTEWMSYPAYYTDGAGKPLVRTGTRHATIAPYGPFRCGDGQIVFFGIQNAREWTALCAQVLEDAALASDPRFLDNPQRMQNRDALETLIEEHFAKFSVERGDPAARRRRHCQCQHEYGRKLPGSIRNCTPAIGFRRSVHQTDR